MCKMDSGKGGVEPMEEGSKIKAGMESSQLKSSQSRVIGIITKEIREANSRYCGFSQLECPRFEGEDFEG